MYPYSAGGSLRHPSFVAAVHHSFTEINLYRSYILHNIRSIYVHVCRPSDFASCVYHPVPAKFLYFRIIVKIRIKTPNFAYIIVNAISPNLDLRF